MSYWLCILNRENFEPVKNKLIWGVSEYHKKSLYRSKMGNVFAFYLIGEVIEEARKEPAIGGVFKVISKPYEDSSDIFPSKRFADEFYPYRVKLELVRIFHPELPFKPLIPKLKFITNRKNYAGHIFGKAMRTIPESDMKVILETN